MQGERLAGVNTMHAQEASRGLAGAQLIRLIIGALKPWVAHSCNPSLREVEAVGSEVQDHLWLHSKLKVSLSNMGLCEEGKGR